MEPRLQRRVQRYGWDLAAPAYEPLWRKQLAIVHDRLLERMALAPGERVLDVACGTGIVSALASQAVGERGGVVGIDISGRMIELACRRANGSMASETAFARMDAEDLELPDASFDVALSALGLMYMPDPRRALTEMMRVVRPGGRLGLVVWGERSACGWSPVFPIVDAVVTSSLCPPFFDLGCKGALRHLCLDAGLDVSSDERIDATLEYIDDSEACAASFVGGPVALAWARLDEATRSRVRANYIAAIAPWRCEQGYRIPSEFVVVTARVPGAATAPTRR